MESLLSPVKKKINSNFVVCSFDMELTNVFGEVDTPATP